MAGRCGFGVNVGCYGCESAMFGGESGLCSGFVGRDAVCGEEFSEIPTVSVRAPHMAESTA